MKHYPNCHANYPEKPENEPPQHIVEEIIDGYYVRTCSDCGAFETNLPDDEDDPYWDDVRN